MTEVAAEIRYDFQSAYGRLQGAVTLRTLSEAQETCRRLNDEFGDGSHWVVAQNSPFGEQSEN